MMILIAVLFGVIAIAHISGLILDYFRGGKGSLNDSFDEAQKKDPFD